MKTLVTCCMLFGLLASLAGCATNQGGTGDYQEYNQGYDTYDPSRPATQNPPPDRPIWPDTSMPPAQTP